MHDGPEIEVLTPLDFERKVVGRHLVGRLAETISVVEHVGIGDPAFDKRYQAHADDSARAKQYLGDGQRRSSIAALLEEG